MKQLTPLAFHYSDSQPGNIRTKHLPFVTVIMPIRNEAGYIRESLSAVLAQNYPSDRMEVIIADGMSDDRTRLVIERVLRSSRVDRVRDAEPPASPSPSLRIVDNPGYIVPTGLNAAIREARGDIIIRVDGHCEIGSNYVSKCVEVLDDTGADCVGGCMMTVGETDLAGGIALAQSSIFGVGGAAFRTGRKKPGIVDTLAFGAYRREVFDRIGGFDEELARNQDDEFNFRLIQAGGKIWLDPTIRSVYHSRESLGGLWRQYYQYGFYKVRVMQKRQAIPAWRHLVPGLFVLGLLGSLLLALLTRQPLWALSVIGPYSGANVVASLWTARQHWRTLPILPIAFATMHVAYGTGFLWGLWRWRRWGFRFAG